MKRNIIHLTFRFLTGLSAVVACAVLLSIIGFIISRGWSALSWSFFTEQIVEEFYTTFSAPLFYS